MTDKMLEMTQSLIRRMGEKINLSEGVIEEIIQPDRVIEVKVVIKGDNGEKKVFQGFRSQHNNVLGPYKGGIRFHESVSREEVVALSTLMSLKCAVAGLPYGGGKGGVIVDPKSLSERELEQLSRSYAKEIAPFIGAWRDVPAPDVNTNPTIMAWMLDEYEKWLGEKARATFTGKPVELGGSLGRTEATGRGGVVILSALLSKLGRNLKSKGKKPTIAVQGFGNVGYYFAKIAYESGFEVVAVSDSKGAIYVDGGLNPETTLKCKKEKGTVAGCYCKGSVCDIKFGKAIDSNSLLELPVDILVPAALENTITAENAGKIKAKVIIEMANGPVSAEAYPILDKNGVVVVPDILANSGGVTVSYFEWVQSLQGYWWSEAEVNDKLKKQMIKAFDTVWQKASELKTNLKEAAFAVALARIAKKN